VDIDNSFHNSSALKKFNGQKAQKGKYSKRLIFTNLFFTNEK